MRAPHLMIGAALAVGAIVLAPTAQAGPAAAPASQVVAAAPATHTREAQVFAVTNSGSFSSQAAIVSQINAGPLADWEAESDGVISDFTVTKSGPLTIGDDPSTAVNEASQGFVCSFSDYSTYVLEEAAKAQASTPSRPYANIIILLSGDPACASDADGVDGTATTGYAGLASGKKDGKNGFDYAIVRMDDTRWKSTLVHQLGHNFGLGDASARACQTCGVDYEAGGEDLDLYSPMGFAGNNAPTALDARYREFLGLTTSSEVSVPLLGTGDTETITKHVITPRGSNSGKRAIKVVDPVAGTVFWVEYRTDVGRDAGAAYDTDAWLHDTGTLTFGSGVTISIQRTSPTNDPTVELVPRENGAYDSGRWVVGSTYKPPSGKVRIFIKSISPTSAEVHVARVHRPFTQAPYPKVTGTPKVGQKLVVARGTWSPTPDAYRYQWQQRTATGAYQNISGATYASYTVAPVYRGRYVRVVVTARKQGYLATSRTAPGVKIG